jgi:NADH:ubiquinone oxidoreductase subunit 6 (subunit J)
MDQILYSVFAAVAAASALLAVTRKNAVAAACWLVVMFFGLAGVFVVLEAYLVAVIQILVYAGAIMVLFLFVIMLLDLRSEQLKAHAGPSLRIGGVLLAGVFFGAVVFALRDAASSTGTADRVAAVLRLPAPPPPAGAAPETAPVLPPPVAVPLREVDKASVAEDLDVKSPEARAFVVGARVWRGEATVGGKPVRLLVSPLTVADTPGGAHDVTYVLRAPSSGTGGDAVAWGTTEAGTVDVGRAIPGATLDLAVVHGGLGASPAGGPDGSPKAIGASLFDLWLLPFEVTSLLLTSAIFGAVVLTKRRLAT